MKKNFLYTVLFVLMLTSCSEQEVIKQPSTPTGGTKVRPPTDVTSGELLIKFNPAIAEILDQVLTVATGNGGTMTRSRIPSTDEVLDILGTHHSECIFPVDTKSEERTRISGLHLWYRVKFDENTDLKKAAGRPAKLGEVAKVQANDHIQCAYKVDDYRSYASESALRQEAATRIVTTGNTFSNPGLTYQWHYNNSGSNSFDNQNVLKDDSRPGYDVGCMEAQKKCMDDPSIIVVVLDKDVMYTHPDLKGSMWISEKEELYAGKDVDGNGYKDGRYGYNFVSSSEIISWMDAVDTGHGTHVASAIAAMNNNGEGVCDTAGDDGSKNSGVEIISCQASTSEADVTLDTEVRAMKYAADSGAVILRCSQGYNSSLTNLIEGYIPGPGSGEEWEELHPLERDVLDYFIDNAGSPNGVIDGGLTIFASRNKYAEMAAFPATCSKYISVSTIAADFTPASYSNHGKGVTISAPGGDTGYYNPVGRGDPEGWEEGIHSSLILSAWI